MRKLPIDFILPYSIRYINKRMNRQPLRKGRNFHQYKSVSNLECMLSRSNTFPPSGLHRNSEASTAYRLCTMVEDLVNDIPQYDFQKQLLRICNSDTQLDFWKFWKDTERKDASNNELPSYLHSLPVLDAVSSNVWFDIWNPINN